MADLPPSPNDATPLTGMEAEPAPPPSAFLPRPRWRRIGRVAAWVIAVGLALVMAAIAWLAVTAPLSRSLKPIAPPSLTLLSADGQFIARKGAIIDSPVVVARLPAHVPRAFIAIEDRRFYSHWGVDPWGIARAMWRNVRAGGLREGGSTITQQLAKGSFLTADRTAGRKLREMLIALWLEAWLTKDQILERYLSSVYFGDNVYGLRAASLHYFSRPPERLTVAQAAMLAGLVKAPSRLAPTLNLRGARERAALVTQAMVEAGFLTPTARARLAPARLNVRKLEQSTTGTYFSDWVLPQARDQAGEIYSQQSVTTTLDSAIQRMTVDAVRRAPLGKAQVAVVVMRPDGAVVAMIGGKNYRTSAFNRAAQARRQPGSTFKLFVYLAALRAGMTPDDMVDDTPITTGTYRPANHNGRYRGRITLRQAFAVSSNVAAVRLAQQVGVRNVIRAARDLGVTAPLTEDLSLALGTSGISLVELAQAYAAIAAGAYPVRAHGLPPEDRSWLAALIDRQRTFGAAELEEMRDLLAAAANRGTGRAASLRTRTFGKTGTTQDNRDAIFVGYAGGLVTAVWVGNDDNSPLPGFAGGGVPAHIWRDIMRQAVEHGSLRDDEGDDVPANALDEAANAIANVSVQTELGNATLSIDGDGLRLRGGPLDIDIPLTGRDSSAPAPPPAAPPAPAPPPPADR
jgi:penicillin-binding protein 1A